MVKRIGPILIVLYQALACVAMLAVVGLVRDYQAKPFLGTFIDKTLVLSTVGHFRNPAWQILNLDLSFGHRLIAINAEGIHDVNHLYQTLEGYQVGDTISASIEDQQQNIAVYPVTLQKFPPSDFFAYFILPWVVGVFFLVCSLWIFAFRRRDIAGQIFAIFSSSVALLLVTWFDLCTTNRVTVLWNFGLCMAGGGIASLAMIFPEENKMIPKYPVLRWVWFIPAIVIFVLVASTLGNERPMQVIQLRQLGFGFVGLSFFFYLVVMFYRRSYSSIPMVRQQAKLILYGTAFSIVSIATWLLLRIVWTTLRFHPYLLLPMPILPLVIAYTLARYRSLQMEYIFNRVIAYVMLVFLIAVGYSLLVSGITLVLGSTLDITNPYLVGGVVFVLAFLFNPLLNRVQRVVDSVFSRGEGLLQNRLQSFGDELTQAMTMGGILDLLRRYVQEPITPFHLHIFVLDPMSKYYEATPDATGIKTSDLRFGLTSPLVELLSQQRDALFLGDIKTLPAKLQPEKARIGIMGSQLFVPLPGRNRLAGWLALGSRQSGEPYANRELEYLDSLCDQAALAIERAQVVADLEQRVHAMNVLTRISQGINVTLAFDDILELIYAQTYQIIPTKDFFITLYEGFGNVLYHVFYLENDERLNEKENQPIPIGRGLEREVVQTRRILVSDDYERECRVRGYLPNIEGIFSWIGVPLNAGAETIGVISLGSRDTAVIYTDEQANLVQAIADQAAGAIVKSRLLQEAERRARQLTTLNEVSRSMTSTLELSPLLNQILVSAVEILNCEAGSFLLLDEPTGDLIFEVAVGTVGSELVGQRLPAGTGLSGKAVETRQPIIVNDVRRSQDWSFKQDEQTGFTTNDLLVVPMIYKEKVIGVIEIINRKDKLPFTMDDQELLAAFSSQAAVALENARLYTQTDQTLAARVEELSVMQRIDRELNVSLDVKRAMRITLDWAMRQSHSDAGLLGIVAEEGVQVMAWQGYANEIEPYLENVLPDSLHTVLTSIQTGQTQRYLLGADQKNSPLLLKGAQAQVVVPLKREEKVVGILLLENIRAERYPEEVLAFLSRLSDHASIAITNARLYDEVQSANQAKTDFVSLVSHELKTPMTSIRGFTDLLSAGVVGPINENQSNFLATIRSNVDRMATLVSDLTDISRIEVGKLRLDFTSVTVDEVIEEVMHSTQGQIKEKQQILQLEMQEKLPAMWGDRMRLIQILTNLVSNANKYTPNEGKIIIKADATEDRWKQTGSKVILLSVRDTGYGISPENQSKIFQKFFRAEDEKIRDVSGTGLGLSITKQLVEMQGGTIWFESEFRQGSTFYFTVPIAETT